MTRRGLTLIELLAATVLLTLMAGVLVPILKLAPQQTAGTDESRLSCTELLLAIDDLLIEDALSRERLDHVIAGEAAEIDWEHEDSLRRIRVSRVTHESQIYIDSDVQQSQGQATRRQPFPDAYAWLEFECDGCEVLRVFARPQQSAQQGAQP